MTKKQRQVLGVALVLIGFLYLPVGRPVAVLIIAVALIFLLWKAPKQESFLTVGIISFLTGLACVAALRPVVTSRIIDPVHGIGTFLILLSIFCFIFAMKYSTKWFRRQCLVLLILSTLLAIRVLYKWLIDLS